MNFDAMGFLAGLFEQIKPELLDLAVVLVVALLVQGLRYAGIVVNANTQAELDLHTRKAIQIVEEESARRKAAGEPPLTSSQKTALARDYILARLNENRSRLLAVVLGRIFKSYAMPTSTTVTANIDAELAGMGQGATVASGN